jgi:DNA-binding response OmpR family regulator
MTASPTANTFRILHVEDDSAIAHSLQEGLRREGYDVTWRNTGVGGVEYALENKPHLVILDVRLPDSSGFDVCKRLRQLGLRMPILMLTVQSEEMDKVLGLEMGADDYLTKPYGLRELLSRVRALLRRAYGELSSTDAEVLYAGDLVIDRGRAQVWRGDELINLTPIEFRLLAYLAQNAGQALTRAQLLDAVWGYESDPETDKTVNVHIRRLRQKVELNPDAPTLILTVPGVGYRLVNRES